MQSRQCNKRRVKDASCNNSYSFHATLNHRLEGPTWEQIELREFSERTPIYREKIRFRRTRGRWSMEIDNRCVNRIRDFLERNQEQNLLELVISRSPLRCAITLSQLNGPWFKGGKFSQSGAESNSFIYICDLTSSSIWYSQFTQSNTSRAKHNSSSFVGDRGNLCGCNPRARLDERNFVNRSRFLHSSWTKRIERGTSRGRSRGADMVDAHDISVAILHRRYSRVNILNLNTPSDFVAQLEPLNLFLSTFILS